MSLAGLLGPTMSTTKRLEYIHMIRGFAIVLIVALHCQQVLDWPRTDKTIELLNIIIWDGSSIFFAISGFLFHHLSRKFDYLGYLQGKLKNVIVPFLVIGLPGVVHTLGFWKVAESHPEISDKSQFLHFLFLYAYPGEQYNSALWFIPVIATYFLAAPIFIWLIRWPRYLLIALASAFLYALTDSRPSIYKYQHFDLVLYFAFPYLLGIATSLYREKITTFIDQYLVLAFLILCLVIAVQFFSNDGSLDRFTKPMGDLGVNLYPLNRALVFLAFIGLFRVNERHPVPILTPLLHRLGDLSFPIFFVHMYFMKIMFESRFGFDLEGSILNVIFSTTLTLAVSAVFAMSVRYLLGVRSKYVIGS
jgi:probable poly-beta-1,6-N-acetyl-D-glucosamine export protein